MKITDKMRLDWLSKQEWPFRLSVWGGTPKRSAWRMQKGNDPFLGIGGTPRKAIDAAIRDERRGGWK